MKQLIDDYKRRLDTVTGMLEAFNSSGSINDIKKKERLTTKASEYRTFIAELERELLLESAESTINKMIDLGLIKRVDKSLIEVIQTIPQQAQAQYSLEQQLQELRVVANKLGLYDAADFIRSVVRGEDTTFVTKKEIETFMNDVSDGTGIWSDTSYRILRFIGIDPTQGT